MITETRKSIEGKNCKLCNCIEVNLIMKPCQMAYSNRFLIGDTENQSYHLMLVGVCRNCGLVQLVEPAHPSQLKSRFDWITYNEPEEHLDSLTETIYSLTGMNASTVVGSISFKDDSLLERLRKKDLNHTWKVLPDKHLGVRGETVGIATIQAKLSAGEMTDALLRTEKADVLLARHILEHVHELKPFFASLKRLLKPSGYIVLEVPCCDRQMNNNDYSMLWEEHLYYFTPVTFQQCLYEMGFTMVHYERIQYPLEDVLTVIVKNLDKKEDWNTTTVTDVDTEVLRAKQYGENLPEISGEVKSWLLEFKKKKGRIAVLGAGHLAHSYVSLLNIAGEIDCFLDDNPHKVGLMMPGNGLPIYSSDYLIKADIKLCLLAVNPLIDEKIINKFKSFLENGGIFYSIFPESNYALNHLNQIPKIVERR